MFGIYRYVMGLAVAAFHLGALTSWLGQYAVFGFYLLSGYLMCRVLDSVYPATPGGRLAFLANRALRIYPAYWLTAGLSIAVLAIAAAEAQALNAALVMPTTGTDWLANATIIGLIHHPVRLVPPAWSLHVELVAYMGMAAILAHSRAIVVAWFAASAAYTGWLIASGASWEARYFPIEAASLPFSAGALLHKLRLRVPHAWHAILASGLWLGHAVCAGAIWADPMLVGHYVSLALSMYLVAALATLHRADIPRWLSRLDTRLGDLAYPVFLCHWTVGAIVLWVWGAPVERSAPVFLWSLVPMHLVAAALHHLVERPVELIRDRVRGVRAAHVDLADDPSILPARA